MRYLPAAEAARVGGDWYDAFLQPGGSTMLVIGDVVGHDTAAAAAMGQLRGLLRGHRDLQRRRSRRGAARPGHLDDDAADQDPRHGRRGALRADAGGGRARDHPDALGERRAPPAAGDQPGRQRRRAGRLEGRPPPRRRSGRPPAGVGGDPGPRRDRAALHRRARRAPGRRPGRGHGPAAGRRHRARRPPAREAPGRADRAPGARPPRGRRRAGRRPAAPSGPPPTARRAEPCPELPEAAER